MISGILILIFIGLFLWLTNLGILRLSRDWPLILIFLGIINIFKLSKKGSRKDIIDELAMGKITPAEEKLKKIRK